MKEEPGSVLTIGHSTHDFDEFVSLLKSNGVTVVCDVRSAPYSRFNPQFNKETLEKELRNHGIKYVYLGQELGGRSDDPSCFENGRIQYPRLAKTAAFRRGIERIVRGANEYVVAIMCAEKEPLECHRTLLVAPAIEEAGVSVKHILADGQVETNEAAMERLLGILRMPAADLFRSKQELIAEAIDRQSQRVGFSIADHAENSPDEES
ncbi:hypothetical protein B7486_13450 [cyanobacterium TDX16]|nr:hypothetical protein B7486_13450 [cyanobacterium TDX16]